LDVEVPFSPMSNQGPWLTVISSGPLNGRSFSVRLGNQLLGRDDNADVVLPSTDLSRRHAYLSWDGSSASIADAGSTNGTLVNGRVIERAQALRPGDIIRLGSLDMRFESASEMPTGDTRPDLRPHEWRNEFHGDNYAPINQAARDVNVQNRHDYWFELDDPMQELFQGRGVGRLLMGIGLLVALSGFAAWMYLIFASGASAQSGGDGLFDEKVAGLPIGLVAFGAFALGGVIASIGASMSKAARTRHRDTIRYPR